MRLKDTYKKGLKINSEMIILFHFGTRIRGAK